MQQMKYDNFLANVSQELAGFFDSIEAEYNFDYGAEFEIALCTALRKILPNKYGICRGFIVTEDNKIAGDDVIIYDRLNYPTIRFLEDDNFARKEKVPFEAVYAYVETKHTLHIHGDDGQSLNKAISQIAAVKALSRKPRSWEQIADKSLFLPGVAPIPDFPKILNPLYTIIFARNLSVSEKKNAALRGSEAQSAVIGLNIDPHPDIIVAGPDLILMPFVGPETEVALPSPFYIEGTSRFAAASCPSLAFGIG